MCVCGMRRCWRAVNCADMESDIAKADQELPPRPIPPRDEDCCRSDCPVCVFDLYERELERWKEQVAAILAARAEREKRKPE